MNTVINILSTARTVVICWTAVSIGVGVLWAWALHDRRTEAEEWADREAEARALRDLRFARLRAESTAAS